MTLDELKEYCESVNIAHYLSEEELDKIGNRVLSGFKEDLKSMEEWLSDAKKVEDLVSLKSVRKQTPLPNSSNIKLPIITKACQEFLSTAYPAIVMDDRVVKAKIIGLDLDGSKGRMAKRVTDFMNYQLLKEHEEWELELDNLLNQLSLIGFICKKTYYDPIRKMIKSELCNYYELIINSNVKSLDDASRITHILHLRLNDFVEAKNTVYNECPVFLEKPVEDLITLYSTDELDKSIDVLEQHCKLDLDKDGYSEPYIVTVTKAEGKVLRIVSRYEKKDIVIKKDKVITITPERCFVDYHFLKSPKGKFQSIGFGLLLLHLNEAANSTINQLMDAAHLSNMQGGYKDARCKMIQSGLSLHNPGEWKDVKVMTGAALKDGMMPINYKEPSNVMYQLLGLLISISKDLTASAEINNGTQSSENAKTGATLALQQAGKKTLNSIMKRIYRSLDNEFLQIFILNSKYLNPFEYREIEDDTLAVKATDFDVAKVKIMPVANPNLSSSAERLQEAQYVQSIISLPGIDPVKATTFILKRTQIDGIMDILADPNKKQPPNPEMLKIQADIEESAQKLNIAGKELELKEKDQIIKAHLAESLSLLQRAQADNFIAQAQAQPHLTALKDYEIQLDAISKKIDAQMNLAGMQHEKDMQASDQEHQQSLQEQQIEAQPDANEGSGGVPPQSDNSGTTSSD